MLLITAKDFGLEPEAYTEKNTVFIGNDLIQYTEI